MFLYKVKTSSSEIGQNNLNQTSHGKDGPYSEMM